ncbi:hypothetical protein [Streptomyces sp. CB03238]|uniref:CIS tube protein n=1 Tax=Streptomyces sp. CB03238 TaxID=1907777 RepID=UPI000A11A971|nr:hypothetical protein [Streptomyces sp. CB03238]ORT58173.1 hypothetical protein BKD26_19925 [Streptomyces sp. CB03238]
MGTVSNPKFDSRMTAIPQLGLRGRTAGQAPGGAPLGVYWRGSIVRDNDSSAVHAHPKSSTATYRVDFLFNPSTITVSHESGPMLTADQRSTDGQYVNAGGIGQVTFSLLYDRTYEMISNRSGNEATKRGVLADMDAFYRVTGVYDVSAKGVNARQFNPMQSYNCNFYFGGVGSNSLAYYGYISTLSVQYTHFTREMIPQRCAVNVTVEMTQKGAAQ